MISARRHTTHAPNALSDARGVRDRQLAALSKYLDEYMRSPTFLTSLRKGLMVILSLRRLSGSPPHHDIARNPLPHAAMRRIVP